LRFLRTDISQGSVATRLRRGGVFKYDFVKNFLLNLTVKEFWKSARLIFGKVMSKSLMSCFLTHNVELNLASKPSCCLNVSGDW